MTGRHGWHLPVSRERAHWFIGVGLSLMQKQSDRVRVNKLRSANNGRPDKLMCMCLSVYHPASHAVLPVEISFAARRVVVNIFAKIQRIPADENQTRLSATDARLLRVDDASLRDCPSSPIDTSMLVYYRTTWTARAVREARSA